MSGIDEKMRAPLEVLAANNGSIHGKTKFHKLIFLAEQEEGLENYYKFEKHNYGPYSFDLTEDLNVLERLGLIEVTVEKFSKQGPFEGKSYNYELTPKGKKAIEDSKNSVKESADKVADKWGSESLNSILDYVYDKYMDE